MRGIIIIILAVLLAAAVSGMDSVETFEKEDVTVSIHEFDNQHLAGMFLFMQPGEVNEHEGELVIYSYDTVYKGYDQISWISGDKVISIIADSFAMDTDSEIIAEYLEKFPSSMEETSSFMIEEDIEPVAGIQNHKYKGSARIGRQKIGAYYRPYTSYTTVVAISEDGNIIKHIFPDAKGVGELEDGDDYYYSWVSGNNYITIRFNAGNDVVWGRVEDDEEKIVDLYLEKYPADEIEVPEPEEALDEEPEEIELVIQLYDPVLDVPPFPKDHPGFKGEVYVDGKMVTDDVNDETVLKVKSDSEIVLEIEGYKTVTTKPKAKINLGHKYELFEVPPKHNVDVKSIYGWVKPWYIIGKDTARWGYIDIHPHEKLIQQYALPIKSSNKVEALKHTFNITRALDKPGKHGWWDSDYKVIENGGWTCSDYATLTTSLGNAMNIPTRRVSMAWRDGFDFFGLFKTKHAFSEAYISETGEWVNYDATYKRWIVNDTCFYARDADCIYYATANWGTENEEDLTKNYACGKPVC